MCEYHRQPGNSLLENDAEVLLRQVHPTHIQDGAPTKQAFLPTESHAQLLSTKRERVTPMRAHQDWIERGMDSAGTWGVSVAEVGDAEMHAVDDANNVTEPDHASVNFRELPSKGAAIRKARILRDLAVERGCLYRPAA